MQKVGDNEQINWFYLYDWSINFSNDIFFVWFANTAGLWTITVEQRRFETTRGTDLKIPCTFTHPSGQQNVQIYWKTNGTSECSKKDNDKQAFVYHYNPSCVLPNYQHKTSLIGDITKGNCSLEIRNIQQSDIIYVRVSTDEDKYSFKNNYVTIQLHG